MLSSSSEAKTLVKRLKELDIDEISRNPSSMLKCYPIRDPDKETTVFDEVYCLVNQALMAKSYKFRLFYFLNTFLSSTKVPAYVIAAYMKKLSRLTLDAKPKSLVIILRLIGNLLIRHPVLMVLRDRVDDRARELEIKSDQCTLKDWLDNDPFDNDEVINLKSSNALESYLWELLPLRFHRHPKVAKAASYLNHKTPPDMEFELDDMLR